MNSLKTLFLIVLITLSILSVPVLLIPINSERSDITVYAAKFDGKVKGIVKFIFSPGENVKIIADVNDLPYGLVYPYHVHEFHIKSGNCTSAGPHLDPKGAGKHPNYKCDPDYPEKCEVGDISGKHSGLKPDEDGHIYKVDEDKFLKMSGPYGVEGRSVVIHLPGKAKTRLDCANIYPCKD